MKALLKLTLAFFVIGFLDGIIFPPGSRPLGQLNATAQTARTIALCLDQYSQDHNGHYPEGKTSTEVFQHLLDENYASDPSLFYLAMPGKVKPKGTHLNADNVSWDITCCVDSNTPTDLPVAYLTGYKVSYQSGAKAIPIAWPTRTWSQWWHKSYGSYFMKGLIAVCYKNQNAKLIKADPDGSIPNFIPADFDPKGKAYRQLTP